MYAYLWIKCVHVCGSWSDGKNWDHIKEIKYKKNNLRIMRFKEHPKLAIYARSVLRRAGGGGRGVKDYP